MFSMIYQIFLSCFGVTCFAELVSSQFATCGSLSVSGGTSSTCATTQGCYVNGATCSGCAVGKYKASGTSCSSCWSHSTTLQTGATSQTDCLCIGGYTPATSTSCTACSSNKWKSDISNGACIAIPAHSAVVDYRKAWSCSKGYQLGALQTCDACPIGTTKTYVSNDTCTDCPATFTTASTAQSTASCVCAAGMELSSDGSVCVSCSLGAYKSAISNATCTACSATFTTTDVGSTASSACGCAEGFGYANSKCSPCSTNSYKPTFGNVACTPLPANAISTGTGWLCKAGYSMFNSASCLVCPIGQYQDTATASSACLSCNDYIAGSTTLSTGSNSASLCACPAGTELVENSSQFSTTNSSCFPCPTSKWKSDLSNGKCLDVPDNAIGSGALNGTTGLNTNWVCQAGYFLNSTAVTCDSCPYAFAKVSASNGTCAPCFSSRPNTFPVSPSQCGCSPGYASIGGVGGFCTPCNSTQWKSDASDGSCLPLPPNTTPILQANVQTSWLCSPGYYLTPDSQCAPCPIGTYLDSASNSTSCLSCSDYRNLTSTVSTGSTSATQCLCAPGYRKNSNNNQCGPCYDFYYKATVSDGLCTLCPLTGAICNFSPSTGFQCVEGYGISDDQQSCVACSAGQFKTGIGNRACLSCPVDSVTCTVAEFTCAMGYEPNADSTVCIPCSADFYKNASGNAKCLACPSGMVTSGVGSSFCKCISDQSTSCVDQNCPSGFYKVLEQTKCASCSANTDCSSGNTIGCSPGFLQATVNDTIVCTPCPAGTFQSGDTCINCPSNSTCTAGSVTFSCNPGHTLGDSDTCAACDGFSYKTFSGNYPCVSCKANAATRIFGATSASACVCGPGYQSSGSSCNPCGNGKYKDTYSDDDACVTLTDDNASILDDKTGWQCNAGYTPNDAKTYCVECPAGTTKPAGNLPCSQCSANSTYVESVCLCSAGYGFNSVDSSCLACPSGTYKSATSNTACTTCPDNADCSSGTSYSCNSGYTNSDSGCLSPLQTTQQVVNNIGSNPLYISLAVIGGLVAVFFLVCCVYTCRSKGEDDEFLSTFPVLSKSSAFTSSFDPHAKEKVDGEPAPPSSRARQFVSNTIRRAKGFVPYAAPVDDEEERDRTKSDDRNESSSSKALQFVSKTIRFAKGYRPNPPREASIAGEGSSQDFESSRNDSLDTVSKYPNGMRARAPSKARSVASFDFSSFGSKRNYSSAAKTISEVDNDAVGSLPNPKVFATGHLDHKPKPKATERTYTDLYVEPEVVDTGEGIAAGEIAAIYKVMFLTSNLPASVMRRLKADNDFALKLINADEESPTYDQDDHFAKIKILQKEAKILVALEHENIAHLVAVIQDPFAIIMRLYAGSLDKELYDDVKGKKFTDPAVQIGLMTDIASALVCMHGEGISHNNLITENILLEYDEEDEEHENPRAIVGGLTGACFMTNTSSRKAVNFKYAFTANYTAPEVLKAGEMIPELDLALTDMHAAGMTFYELTQQVKPHYKKSKEEILTVLQTQKSMAWWVAPNSDLTMLIRDMCSFSPSFRPSANALKERLAVLSKQ